MNPVAEVPVFRLNFSSVNFRPTAEGEDGRRARCEWLFHLRPVPGPAFPSPDFSPHPSQVGQYNGLVKSEHRIKDVAEDAVAFVIGSSATFWQPFLAWLSDPLMPDPVDSYTKHVVERTLRNTASEARTDVRYDYYFPPDPRFIHVQTAAHVAGIAFYDRDVMWSVSDVYGLWCVFRSVVIFPDMRWVGPFPSELSSLITEAERLEIKRLTGVASAERWQNPATLLRIRDVVTVGKAHRYQGDQLDFFYPIRCTKQQVLMRAKEYSNSVGQFFPRWQPVTSFSGARTAFQSLRVGNAIYVLGGYSVETDGTITYYNDVQFAFVQEDCTLGPWQQTTPFQGPRSGHSCVLVGDHALLLMGGSSNTGYFDDMQRATVASDGTVGAWERVGSLPRPQSNHVSFTFAGKLRAFVSIVGGVGSVGGNTVHFDDVWSCPLSKDGTVDGSWEQSSFHFKGGRAAAACFLEEGTLFVLGGWGDNFIDDVFSDMQYAPFCQDGQVEPWHVASCDMRIAVHSHAIIVREGRVFVFGGSGGEGNLFNNIAFCTVNVRGTIGKWYWNRHQMPSARWGHQVIATDKGIYLLGGAEKASFLNTVHFAPHQ